MIADDVQRLRLLALQALDVGEQAIDGCAPDKQGANGLAKQYSQQTADNQ